MNYLSFFILLFYTTLAYSHPVNQVKRTSATENGIYRKANQGQPIDTVRSVKDGQWTDPTVWSVGRVPIINDVVSLVHTVTIPSGVVTTVQSLLYNANGHLSFEDVNAKLQFYPRFRIKRVVGTGLRSYGSTVYNYDSQGMLVNYVVHSGSSYLAENGSGTIGTLIYNAQGQLGQIISQLSSTTTKRFDYTYDNNGRIISVQRYDDSANPGTYTLTDTYTLEYSTGRFPVKLTSAPATNPSNTRVEQYTYSNGNISTVVVTDSYSTTTINYSATTSPNPFYGSFLGYPSFTSYCINLVEESGHTYMDTYNSYGYIVKQIEKISGGNVDNSTTYEYEMY